TAPRAGLHSSAHSFRAPSDAVRLFHTLRTGSHRSRTPGTRIALLKITHRTDRPLPPPGSRGRFEHKEPAMLNAAFPFLARFRTCGSALLVAALAVLLGCQKKAPPPVSSAPPVIPVAQPAERDVTDFAEYTGRTDAVASVSIK